MCFVDWKEGWKTELRPESQGSMRIVKVPGTRVVWFDGVVLVDAGAKSRRKVLSELRCFIVKDIFFWDGRWEMDRLM